jgi:hypothetical protein
MNFIVAFLSGFCIYYYEGVVQYFFVAVFIIYSLMYAFEK